MCIYNNILYIQINLIFEVWDYSVSKVITNTKMSDLVLLSSGQVILRMREVTTQLEIFKFCKMVENGKSFS